MDGKAALLVALGGALGAVARFAVSEWMPRQPFPWATLAVNLLGSFAIGLVLGSSPSGDVRAFAAMGFLGAFTTLSTYSVETIQLWEAGSRGLAALNVLANFLGGPLLALLGWKLA